VLTKNRRLRLDYGYKLKENIIQAIPDFEKRVAAAKMNPRSIKEMINGRLATKETVEKICKALKKPVQQVFDIVDKDRKLSDKTIRHHHGLISAMLTTAVQWQLIHSNPCERVKPPKVDRKEADCYSIEEVHQMMELLEDEPLKYKVMIHTVIFCGLRRGELTNLEWTDINFENGTVTVSKQLQYLPELGIYEVENTKTDSGNRTISMPSELADLFQEYKDWQNKEKIAWGNKWSESNKLFTKENGEPIFPETPSQWFRRFVKRHNLPSLSFHQLRHTNASLLIGQGTDIATVSKRLGHSNVATTLKIYTHAIKEHDREAADKLGSLITKKKK
jgi:integrase